MTIYYVIDDGDWLIENGFLILNDDEMPDGTNFIDRPQDTLVADIPNDTLIASI